MMAKETEFEGKIELDRNKSTKEGEPNKFLEVGGDRTDISRQEVRRNNLESTKPS